MRKSTTLVVLLLLTAGCPRLGAQTTETNSFGNLNATIPEGDPAGMINIQTVNSAITKLLSLRVSLCVAGDFNGGLYGYLRHVQGGVTNFCILLNRVGRTASDPWGYADCGFNVLFDDAAPQGDVHAYETIINPPAGTPLTGAWQADGRNVDPFLVLDTTPRTTYLSSFTNSNPSGDWTLFLADVSYGTTNMLVSWGLLFTGPASPPITWATPANIVYGTALGAGQLNATSSVPGIFTYNPPAGTVLNAGSQVLSVTFNPTDTNNYAPVTANVALVVLPKALTITAANASKLYGAALPALTASYSGFVNGDTASSLTTPPALTTTATAASPVSTYSITASGAASPNYTISYASGTLTVNAAALTISAVNATKLYGAAVPALTASYSGFVNGDTASSLTTPPTLTTTATAASPVGTYPITASGAASPNYTISYASGTLTVSKAALTITAANASKLYGAALPALTASYSGFVNGDTASSLTTPPTLTTTATAASPVGSYPITASGAASPNYTISYASGTLTVNAAALTITAVSTSKLYGAALPALTATYSGFVNGDTASSLTTPPALTTTATPASPVGTYPITASGAASPNYTISYASGTLTVNTAALTITAVSTSKLYGAVLPALTASYSGFVNGDTASSLTTPPALTTTATAASPVGTYPITASGAASPNYTISYASGTLTVSKAALTITAANASKLYGAVLPALTASYSGFVNGDTASSLTTPPALTTTATAASPVGTYSITASGAASPNYTISYASGTLTVNAAALTITAVSTSKLYGAVLPALTASYSGFVNGDTASSLTTPPALTTTATAASPVGSYPITASGAASPNYTISYASGTLTVSKAALTITAANASKLYGAVLPALTASYSGFVNGDTASSLTTPPALTTTATAASPVGTYSITASGAASPNYTISYASGTLTVNTAALTITAVSTSKLYGAVLPALTASYSGFVNGDTASSLTTPPALTTTATAASPVGSYPITASGAASPNYTISYASGTLTVNAAALTITAVSTGKLYGAVLPALTASYSGFVNGDTASSLTTPPTLTTTATAASPVGSYPITAGGAASPNYTISYASGTLTVSKAALTITAANASKLYGAVLPALTASYSGFVNGDTASSLTTPPTLTTTATAASPVGTYPITASGAASPNYTISYASGTLTVNAAALTITAVRYRQALRRGAAGSDSQLQRFRQWGHGQQPDHAAGLDHHGDGGQPRGHLSDHRQRRGQPELHHQLRQRHADCQRGRLDHNCREYRQALRRGAAGSDSQLQRFRQWRHRQQPDHAAGLDHHGDGGQPRGHLSDHRQRRGQPELHHQLCQRHADREQGGAHDHSRQREQALWRGAAGSDGQLQRFRQWRHRQQPDHAAGLDYHGDGGQPRGHLFDHRQRRGQPELHYQLRQRHADCQRGRLDRNCREYRQGLRRSAAGSDSQLQRFRQWGHRQQPDRAASPDHHGDGGQPRGHLLDHRQRRSQSQLHDQLCRRHTDRQPGGADDNRRQREQALRRGAAGFDGQLQRFRQWGHGQQPDHAAGPDHHGDGGQPRGQLSDHRQRRSQSKLHVHIYPGNTGCHQSQHGRRLEFVWKSFAARPDSDLQRLPERRGPGSGDSHGNGAVCYRWRRRGLACVSERGHGQLRHDQPGARLAHRCRAVRRRRELPGYHQLAVACTGDQYSARGQAGDPLSRPHQWRASHHRGLAHQCFGRRWRPDYSRGRHRHHCQRGHCGDLQWMAILYATPGLHQHRHVHLPGYRRLECARGRHGHRRHHGWFRPLAQSGYHKPRQRLARGWRRWYSRQHVYHSVHDQHAAHDELVDPGYSDSRFLRRIRPR